MKALEIKGLRKTFPSNFYLKRFDVLRGIDLTVEPGEIYGFLGPNGAGKTTTMKCLLGLLSPDAGDIRFSGEKLTIKARKRIGFLPEHPYFYDYLTAQELLMFSARLFGIKNDQARQISAELLRRVGVEGHADTLLRKFSKGMVQRVGLAQSLVNDPEFLILDEPFSGLDPIGRKELRDIIVSLKNAGKTIFFSSHILQDMEILVDRVGIIFEGRIVRQGKLSDLISHSVRYYEIVFSGITPERVEKQFPEARASDTSFVIQYDRQELANRVIQQIISGGGEVHSMTPVKMTLEDIFLREVKQ